MEGDRLCAAQFLIDVDQSLVCAYPAWTRAWNVTDNIRKSMRVISEPFLLGCVVVLGDFNANPGPLGGGRRRDDLNQPRVMQCHLNAVFLGSLAKGTGHTYVSGDV